MESRSQKPKALGEVEAEFCRDHPGLILKAAAHYGEEGFAYLIADGVDEAVKDDLLKAAAQALLDRGLPVIPLEGRDVYDVRPLRSGS